MKTTLFNRMTCFCLSIGFIRCCCQYSNCCLCARQHCHCRWPNYYQGSYLYNQMKKDAGFSYLAFYDLTKVLKWTPLNVADPQEASRVTKSLQIDKSGWRREVPRTLNLLSRFSWRLLNQIYIRNSFNEVLTNRPTDATIEDWPTTLTNLRWKPTHLAGTLKKQKTSSQIRCHENFWRVS